MGGGPATVSVSPSRPAPSARPVSSRPAPAPARKLPSLESLKPPSAKSVGASVGRYAVKQAGKAIGKAAADRVGKAIEVIEVLEKVVAAASSEPAARPDLTPSGPGSVTNAAPVVASQASAPAHPGLTVAPSTTGTDPAETPAKPRGTLVSVRKFERGPRVVVGPGVRQPTPTGAPAGDAAIEAAVEVVVETVEAAMTEAAATNEAATIEVATTEAPTTDAVAPVVADAPASGTAAVREKPVVRERPAAKPKAATKKTATKKPATKKLGAKRAPAKAKAAAIPPADGAPSATGADDTP
jgi:hypothetical protein